MTSWTQFRYEAQPMRVRFGAGTLAQLPDEVTELGLRRVMVISTPGRAGLAGTAAAMLGRYAAGIHAEAVMHVPVPAAERARAVSRAAGADGCVAIGGGSAIGLAKAVALTSGLPIIAVPTTYAGSEMTPVWGLTDGWVKRTGRDRRVLPASVLYDPELTLSLSAATSGVSGMNALAHAAEALYAPDASPVTSLMAEEGVRALRAALPKVAEQPADLGARTRALYGAWLCGSCLGATTMSLHHRICHALGGSLGLPHAPAHAVVLPYVLAYNLAGDPEVDSPAARRTGRCRDALARALGVGDPAAALLALNRRIKAPASLGELGMRAADAGPIAGQVAAGGGTNPRPFGEDSVRALLLAAQRGADPAEAAAAATVAGSENNYS
jgi:maleylacetate reductase